MDQKFYSSRKSNSRSQNEQVERVEEATKKLFNQIQFCRPYPLESSIYYRIVIVFLHFLFFVNLTLTFKFFAADSMFLGGSIQTIKLFADSQSHIWFGINAIVKFAIIVNVILQNMIGKRKQDFKILSTTLQKLKKFQRILVQADLQISSILLITLSLVSIFNFLVSIMVIMFSLVFLENYYDQKDRFYINNFYYLTTFRLIVIVGTMLNTLTLFIGNIPVLFLIYHIFASALLILLYLISGWITYNDSLLRWSLLTFLSLYFTISVNLLVYFYWVIQNGSFLIHILLTFTLVQFSLHQRVKNQQMYSINSQRIDQQYFSMFNLVEGSYADIQQKLLISGLLKYHSVLNCANRQCYSLSSEVYDSKKFQYYKNDDFINQRVSFTKFHLQCKFQTYILSHPKNSKKILSYCELLYWKFRNISKTIYWLEFLKASIKQLSLDSLIKYNGLLDIVKKDSQQFSYLLYNRSLDIEHLIEAENIYQMITVDIKTILRERLYTWGLIEKQQIDLSLIRQKIEPTFSSIVSISQSWKKISSYLKQCSQWKQQYVFFILYVKNIKMKNKVLQEFESAQKNIDLGYTLKDSHFQLKSLFGQDTCCLTVYIDDFKAFIKKVSKNFPNVTGYSSEQLIKANISTLLPNTNALHHQKLLECLHKEGKFLDESLYKLRQVYLINRQGFVIPVMKLFKEFVSQAGQLQYVCFIKKLEKKEIVILCNEYFQIQHLTFELIQSLQISANDSKYLTKMNLISMVPALKSISLFSQDRSTKHEQTAQSQQKIAQFQISKDFQEKHFIFYQSQLKQLNKSNLSKYLQLIETLSSKIAQNCIKVQIDFTIISHNNSEYKYYEIKINQSRLKKQIQSLKSNKIQNEIINKVFQKPVNLEQIKNIRKEFNQKDKVREGESAVLNIFVKQEGNQVPHTNCYLRYMKYTWIIFIITLVIVINLSFIGLFSKFVKIQTFSLKMQSLLQINSISSNIIAYYQSYLLNATTFSYVKPKINSFTANLQNAFKKNYYQQLIFDKQINNPRLYYPITSSLLQGNFSYNQIDINYFMQSLFQTLALQTNLTAQTYNYRLLINYFYPSFITFTNNTKSNLHKAFQSHINDIFDLSTITYSVDSLIFFVIALSSIYISLMFFKSMMEMVKIHCQFNPKDIEKIVKYYKKIIDLLDENRDKEIKKQKTSNHQIQRLQQEELQKENNNLNKKSKEIILGNRQTNKYIVYTVKVSACIALLMGLSLWSIYYLNSLVQPIINIQQYGYQQFLYNPNRVITSLIISNRHIYSQEFAPQILYRTIISNSHIQTNTPYLAAPKLNTKFYTYVQNVYFTNLCTLFQNTLKANKFSKNQCQTIAQSSFTRGTIAYSGFQNDRINKIYQQNQNLTASQIKEFYRSLQFSRLFFSNLVSIWQEEIFSLCQQSLWTIKTMIIVLNIILMGVLLYSFIGLFSYLEKEYKYYQQFYRNMMPQYIISNEKIIKSKLIVTSFLQS